MHGLGEEKGGGGPVYSSNETYFAPVIATCLDNHKLVNTRHQNVLFCKFTENVTLLTLAITRGKIPFCHIWEL